jgi:DNA-binding NarL/FixJ family response regulator
VGGAEPITVVIVDDHPALREGTASLLTRESDIDVLGLAGTAALAEAVLAETAPDVVVLDIRLGDDRGLELLARIAASRRPRPAVVIWTAYDLPQYAAYALRAGASAFVLKTAPTCELVEAIRSAARGRVVFSVRPDRAAPTLTERERTLVGYLTDGLSNDEIATTMAIGSRAVEAHLTRLYQRFEVQSRAELAVRAVREGWLDIPVSPSVAVGGEVGAKSR